MIKKCEFCNKKFNVKPSRFEKAKYCSKQCMYSSNIKNLKDKRFGKLVVKEYAFRKNNYAMWLCECDCGKTKIVSSNSLNSGKCQSCGCLLVETLIKRNTKHNKTYTKIYNKYRSMKERCFNPKNQRYKNYGERGIIVCDEWIGEEGFINFYNWSMANGYRDNLTIERIDVNGNYCPENCKWIPIKEQADNKTNTKYIKYNNNYYRIKELAKILNIKEDCLRKRISRNKLKENYNAQD